MASGVDVVTGRTIVPGTNGMTLEAGGQTIAVPGPRLEFNRDADTLLASVDPNGGRALIVEIRDLPAVETLDQVAAASSFFWADARSGSLLQRRYKVTGRHVTWPPTESKAASLCPHLVQSKIRI